MVREIIDKYKYERFDAMQDMYEVNSSPFIQFQQAVNPMNAFMVPGIAQPAESEFSP